MFIKVQEPSIMKAKKRHPVYILSLLIAALSFTSCSSVGDIPKDDIYYSRNTNNPDEYNWDDFQKNTESYGTKTVTSTVTGSDSFDYNSSYQNDVADGEASNENYDYVDEYYDGSYESQLNRFGSNSVNSDFGYYDNYNTGSSGCYSCNSGPNVSLGFSFGMGYGYGWPYYSYYPSYYYPYYYPYYGYNSSYWAGYNAGYWNGYYGGGGYYPGYGGGYYPDYGGPAIAYGPRGSGVTGTKIPRNRTGSNGSTGNVNQKTVVAGTAVTPVSRGGTTSVSTSGQSATNQVVSGRSVKIGKPNSEVTASRDANPQNVVTANRSNISSNKLPEKTYQKPKSYQNLSTQQSKSRSEYIRPTNKTEEGSASQKRSTNVRTNPTTPRDINNSGSNKKDIYTPSRNRSSSYGTTAPSKSYSSPSRSNTSSRSYSSPSSTRSGGGSTSVGTTRSSSNSGGSSSRSYSGSSSSSSSRSSGSTSGGGGSPRRR